jgi:hypothetical protein
MTASRAAVPATLKVISEAVREVASSKGDDCSKVRFSISAVTIRMLLVQN